LNFDPLYLEKNPTYPIDMYVVFNKVQDEKFETEVKTENENSLATILTKKNGKNGPKLNFDPLYLENSPRYDINMNVIFDTVHHKEFDSEGITGSGSSFVRHFDKSRRKRSKIDGIANLRSLQTRRTSAMPPLVSPTPNTPSV